MTGFWYLGSPYSKYPGGRAMAHMEVCRNVALLIKAGVHVYSPIAHTHPVAEFGNINPFDHDIWLPADQPLMDAAKGLIVLQLDGWDNSFGLQCELDEFTQRPVVYMEPGVVPEGLT